LGWIINLFPLFGYVSSARGEARFHSYFMCGINFASFSYFKLDSPDWFIIWFKFLSR
jgi:hypothetical protein